MRNDAPSVLAEWAALANAETRACMGVSVAAEIPERREARAYLAGVMPDEEAAARVAADLERVRAIRERGDDGWERDRQSWADAAGEYHKERGNRVSLVEYKPEELARLRALLPREVTLDRAKAEIQAHHERQRNAAASTIEALVFALRDGLDAVKNPNNQRRLGQLNDKQMQEVAARVQGFMPRIAPAWKPVNVQALLALWSKLR